MLQLICHPPHNEVFPPWGLADNCSCPALLWGLLYDTGGSVLLMLVFCVFARVCTERQRTYGMEMPGRALPPLLAVPPPPPAPSSHCQSHYCKSESTLLPHTDSKHTWSHRLEYEDIISFWSFKWLIIPTGNIIHISSSLSRSLTHTSQHDKAPFLLPTQTSSCFIHTSPT